jgi:hypothetical protein
MNSMHCVHAEKRMTHLPTRLSSRYQPLVACRQPEGFAASAIIGRGWWLEAISARIDAMLLACRSAQVISPMRRCCFSFTDRGGGVTADQPAVVS